MILNLNLYRKINMTKIEWTNKTWNPISGCTKYSEGCQHCYAAVMHNRLTAMGQEKYKFPFNNVVFHYEELDSQKLKKKLGRKPKMVFVNSMSDTFHEKISDEQIDKILDVCRTLREHTFQILTKRAFRVTDFIYPDNVWLGVTVEKEDKKFRIDNLRHADAKIKFLSCEPLLEDLGELDLTGINWVIVGGESGPGARPLKPDWVRNILKQCREQNVPFFFKQWGEWCTGPQIDYELIKEKYAKNIHTTSDGSCILLNVECKPDYGYKVGRKYAGSLLDGKHYKEYPEKYGSS